MKGLVKQYRILGMEMTEKEYLKVLDFIRENYPPDLWNEKPNLEKGIIINKILRESKKGKLRKVI
jgi:hypothetical protein